MPAKKLGFGCMRLPLLDEKDSTKVDMKQFCKMVDLFLKRGFTYFDTAYVYHNGISESLVKEALVKRYPRDKFTIATKLPLMDMKEKADNERIFDEQLERLGVEYIDYYLLHGINASNYKKVNAFECFDFISRKKVQGNIKKIGFSFHDKAELLDEILTEHPETEFVQLQLNYLDWESETIQSRKCYEVCKKHGKPVIVMEPVKGGTLAKVPDQVEKSFKKYAPEASIPSWAIRFAASQDNVMMVLSGMSDLAQLEDNTEYMQEFKKINEDENKLIEKAAEVINSSVAVACTGCSYCVEGCPNNIPIPKYIAMYNAQKQFGRQSNSFFYYMNYIEDGFGRASDCTECGQCKEACPQHLEVPDLMKKVSEEFDTPPNFN